MVYPPVLQPSLVLPFFSHTASPHHLFWQPGTTGSSAFPQPADLSVQDEGQTSALRSSAARPSSCLARRGGRDVLGLDPGAEPARAGAAPRRVGGPRAHAPLPV